jgi:uncharacterized protein YpmB
MNCLIWNRDKDAFVKSDVVDSVKIMSIQYHREKPRYEVSCYMKNGRSFKIGDYEDKKEAQGTLEVISEMMEARDSIC